MRRPPLESSLAVCHRPSISLQLTDQTSCHTRVAGASEATINAGFEDQQAALEQTVSQPVRRTATGFVCCFPEQVQHRWEQVAAVPKQRVSTSLQERSSHRMLLPALCRVLPLLPKARRNSTRCHLKRNQRHPLQRSVSSSRETSNCVSVQAQVSDVSTEPADSRSSQKRIPDETKQLRAAAGNGAAGNEAEAAAAVVTSSRNLASPRYLVQHRVWGTEGRVRRSNVYTKEVLDQNKKLKVLVVRLAHSSRHFSSWHSSSWHFTAG